MAEKPLPMIARRFISRTGHVDLWDMLADDGPVKITRTGILAREALGRDPERYKLELPKGIKPGPAQTRAEEEAAAAAAELDNEPPDPVFGKRNQP